MTDAHENTAQAAEQSIQPTAADAVTDPSMAPMDDDAGGPTADSTDDLDEMEEPDAQEAAAQLGDFA